MRIWKVVGCLAVFLTCSWSVEARRGGRRVRSSLYLDHSLVRVYWNDGDSFRVLGGSRRGRVRARLKGFNTLESHGPVHRWGKWSASELSWIAKKATWLARKGRWNCRQVGRKDSYGRVLVLCPDLARALIKKGLAHVYSVRGQGNRDWLKLQKQAQASRVGMWAKGVPSHIITSLHSTGEGRSPAYNRLISTSTGASTMLRHRRRYRTCEWVCEKGSCMLYVPFKRRYGYRRARCLRYKREKALD